MTAARFAGVWNTRTNHGQAPERRVCVLTLVPHTSVLTSHVHVPFDMLPTSAMSTFPPLTSRPPFLCEVGP
jgi:hypothetical protein